MKKIIAGSILIFIIGVSFTEMRLFGPGGYDLRQFFFTFRDDTDTIMRVSTIAGVKINTRQYMNIDSVETITSLGSDYYQVIDASTGKFKKILPSNTGESVLWRSSTTAATSGTGETDLFTYTTPANTLNATDEFLEYYVSGVINPSAVNDGGNITMRVYWAGTEIIETISLSAIANPFVVQVNVHRTGASAAFVTVDIAGGGFASGVGNLYQSASVTTTFSNTNIIKITGQASDADQGMNTVVGNLKRWK